MTGKIYISIKDIAPLVGYEAHNGEYKVDIEDRNKMYVEAKDGTETTSFYLNSNTISKVVPGTTEDYENIVINEPVIMLNDKLYIVAEGFIVGFNSLLTYDSANNRITIQTLPNLIESYSAVITQYGYSALSEDFNNQKALIYGMIVASKDNNGKIGVISVNGEEIISPRYNKIQFIEASGEFIITNSSEKVGIAYSTGQTKITVSYDEIKPIDSKKGLYLVKSNNKYGIIDSSENFVVHIEYDQIGIDTSKFPADNIKNQYILYDNIIPAKLNGKWRLLDIEGERLNNNEYDEVGFINTALKDRVVNNCLTIGESKVIVVAKDGKYGGVDIQGHDIIPTNFEAIYSLTSAGVTSYYILFNDTEYNAIDYIDAIKKMYGYDYGEIDTGVTDLDTEQEDEEQGNTVNQDDGNNVDDTSNQVDVTSNVTTNANAVQDNTNVI